jgi:hypothetical protein
MIVQGIRQDFEREEDTTHLNCFALIKDCQ